MTLLDRGDKLLVVHRRLFRDDAQRYFLGVVASYADGIAKVDGHTWVRDEQSGVIARKEGRRKKLLSLSSGTLIVYELDRQTDLEDVRFDRKEGKTLLTCGSTELMDLTEGSHPCGR